VSYIESENVILKATHLLETACMITGNIT